MANKEILPFFSCLNDSPIKVLSILSARMTKKCFSSASQNMTKPLVSCFDLECLDFEERSYSQLPCCLSPDYKYLHVRQIFHQLCFPSQIIADCVRYIINKYLFKVWVISYIACVIRIHLHTVGNQDSLVYVYRTKLPKTI